jgi:glycosyltransferase involved in cell wall biosynthesis
VLRSDISVAMATYNGALFIQEQLESISAQNLLPRELVVSDDCSTDKTLEIIENFKRTAPFPVTVLSNPRNLGYADNFFRAVGACTGSWISFSDQDDVWLPNKLADCAAAIAENPSAVMFLQNAILCDGDLAQTGRIFPDLLKPGLYPPRSQNCLWVWHGFLQTVSRQIFSLPTDARPLHYSRGFGQTAHDVWTCSMANGVGDIVVLRPVAALYRRHTAALSGSHRKLSLNDKITLSREVGVETYAHLSEVAKTYGAYLRGAAVSPGGQAWREGLLRLADDFDRFEKIQANRAAIYGARAMSARMIAYWRIWRLGGYLGPKTVSLGLRSSLKDLIAIFMPRH